MLSALASPSVCVIDDEEEDYLPILSVLNSNFVSTVHLLGTIDGLPPKPFEELKLVFLDLHLSGSIGKDAASYTANIFRKVVSAQTAPIIVVIWSKYAGDKIDVSGQPPEDQETEAELFKRTLLGAERIYEGRLIFVEMAKPKKDDRPAEWHETLRIEIDSALQGHPAVELLWAWSGLVASGSTSVSRDLTFGAQAAIAGSSRTLQQGLMATFQNLAKAQSEGDFGAETAPKHFLTVMTQLLMDQLEHRTGVSRISTHGAWLSQDPPGQVPTNFAGKMNALLLSTEVSSGAATYAPGTVYKIKDEVGFRSAFGKELNDLLGMWLKFESQNWAAWRQSVHPVLIELSPVCDLAQGHRVTSLLVAGVVAPVSYLNILNKTGEAFGKIAKFDLRWPTAGFAAQEVVLGFCNRYRTTLPAAELANWLEPWFRLRELPVASIRNVNASHAARVGYVSL